MRKNSLEYIKRREENSFQLFAARGKHSKMQQGGTYAADNIFLQKKNGGIYRDVF
jgi:hypothetical protein